MTTTEIQPDRITGSTSLVPATVTRVEAGQVLLRLDTDPPPARLWATPALAHVYAPAEGDRVLAIGAGDAWYVIGVLATTGPTTITAVGDLQLRSLTGSVDLISAKSVNVRAPLMSVTVDRLQTVARAVSETCVEALRWVKDRLDVRAGRSQTVVDTLCRTKAQRVITRADKEIKLDGETIHLG